MSDRILDKIKDWRDFRKDIKSLSEHDQIENIVKYWAKVPTVNFVLNYNEYDKWPTPWELLTDGYFDSVTIAYMMLQTFLTIGWSEDRFRLEYIKPDEASDFIMVLIIDEKYILNYSYNEVYNITNYKYDRRLINLIFDGNKLKEF